MTETCLSPNCRQSLAARFSGPVVIAGAFIFMACWTWSTWPDCFYDFGSQLYYAWQITKGKTLYTDIAYFNGPLSQYFNAGVFLLFGVSLRTLVWVNLAILVGTLVLVYRMFSRMGDRFTATVACLVFILVFAFSQYVGIGNYNWVCPYTHEVTHGVALSLAAIMALSAFGRSGRTGWLWLTGALLGLVFLTKAEISAPAIGAVGIGLILLTRIRPARWSLAKRLAMVAAAAIVVIAIAFVLLTLAMPAATAGRAILGSWPWVFNKQIAGLKFYQQGLGTDDIAENLWRMLVVGAGYLVIIAGGVVMAMARGKWRSLGWVFTGALAIALVLGWKTVPWEQIARPWPVFMGALVVMSIVKVWNKHGVLPCEHQAWGTRAMLAVLALGLLGKMVLNARIAQYGFALAMPAGILLVDALVGWGPKWVREHGGSGPALRSAMLVLIAATVMVYLWACQGFVSAKTIVVGTGADQFWAGSRGVEVELARQAIDRQFSPRTTLAVMPQGLMLNYLTRRTNPSPDLNLMPPEVLSEGEGQILTELEKKLPDVIVLTRKDASERGFVLTEGHYEYGRQILAWVKGHYQVMGALKFPKGVQSELGLLFLRKK